MIDIWREGNRRSMHSEPAGKGLSPLVGFHHSDEFRLAFYAFRPFRPRTLIQLFWISAVDYWALAAQKM